jgi:sulfur-carrier protein
MQVNVLFFGVLAQVTGTDCRVYREVRSTDELLISIRDDYPEILHYNFRISLNSSIINDRADLKDGDEVVLIPPFTGG